ncbi:MAG TPA: hypothetical protein VIJ51_02195 [Solirubrobacteraceae bacterium]
MGADFGHEEIAAPHLIDSEVTNVLRRLARQGSLTDEPATSALEGFARLTRAPGVSGAVDLL